MLIKEIYVEPVIREIKNREKYLNSISWEVLNIKLILGESDKINSMKICFKRCFWLQKKADLVTPTQGTGTVKFYHLLLIFRKNYS
jgi:hypothetical protein